MIGMGELRDGLYYFRGLQLPFIAVVSYSSSSTLWHERLSHLSFDQLSLIVELSSSSFKNLNKYCDVCY